MEFSQQQLSSAAPSPLYIHRQPHVALPSAPLDLQQLRPITALLSLQLAGQLPVTAPLFQQPPGLPFLMPQQVFPATFTGPLLAPHSSSVRPFLDQSQDPPPPAVHHRYQQPSSPPLPSPLISQPLIVSLPMPDFVNNGAAFPTHGHAGSAPVALSFGSLPLIGLLGAKAGLQANLIRRLEMTVSAHVGTKTVILRRRGNLTLGAGSVRSGLLILGCEFGKKIGRQAFDEFLKKYIATFKFQSIDTETFLDFLKANVHGIEGHIDLKVWTEGTGIPPDAMEPVSDIYTKIVSLANEFKVGKMPNEDEVADWGGMEWELYLENLPKSVDASQVSALDARYRLSESQDYEVKVAFLQLAISSRCSNYYNEVEKTLKEVGRMKYLRPLYRALVEGTGREEEKIFAKRVFSEACACYHPIAQGVHRKFAWSTSNGDIYETQVMEQLSDPSDAAIEFFACLDHKLNKVNQFFKAKEKEFLERGKSLKKTMEILIELKAAVKEKRAKGHFCQDSKEEDSISGTISCDLVMNLNMLAFVKILKKFNKVTNKQVLPTYLSVVESSYFNSPDKTVSNVVEEKAKWIFDKIKGLKASEAFFSAFISSIFNSPMIFFDSTPVGRILTRASSDLSVLDFDIPLGFSFVMAALTEVLATIGIMASVAWQVLFLGIFAMGYYQKSTGELMRINGTTKATVMNYASETALGVATIRAFGVVHHFSSNYLKFVDTDAKVFLSRWYSSLANYIVSVERIKPYLHIPPETHAIVEDNRTPTSWHQKGRIELLDLKQVWDEVGETDEERDKMLLQLEQECLDVYKRKVDHAMKSRAQLLQTLANARVDLTNLLSALGEKSYVGICSFVRTSGHTVCVTPIRRRHITPLRSCRTAAVVDVPLTDVMSRLQPGAVASSAITPRRLHTNTALSPPAHRTRLCRCRPREVAAATVVPSRSPTAPRRLVVGVPSIPMQPGFSATLTGTSDSVNKGSQSSSPLAGPFHIPAAQLQQLQSAVGIPFSALGPNLAARFNSQENFIEAQHPSLTQA
ncbi:leukotriene a-4 hydrolase homolog [Phtheirospermum japonicum]|uniref:Leukotriene a-4 hydrolase homolog n=1 Tax=Phtheirospermum japonicum TaxID=374723 RepID=A0A830CTF9_9LAMI|nr:leukotriene a-4 hydrolase homolog [Phtheirospermum japonicum]